MGKGLKGLIVDAYDIGGKTKRARFLANEKGQFWPEAGADFGMQKTITPNNVAAADFMSTLVSALRGNGQWDDNADLHAFDICGPVYNGTCLRLVNRGVLEKFQVGYDVVVNDAMAAFLGSLVAGVAKGHRGGAVYGTLGTGFGGAMRVWASGDDWQERLFFYDVEMHFAIPKNGNSVECNCRMPNCAEALVKERAVRDLLLEEGVDLQRLVKPGKLTFDAGRDIEYQIRQGTKCDQREKINTALDTWYSRLAQVFANIHGNHVVGGDNERPKALFILGGGLSCLVNPTKVRQYMLQLSDNQPQNGTNFEVCCETMLGNRAGVIGATTAVLMRKLNLSIDEIDYLPYGPFQKRGKK